MWDGAGGLCRGMRVVLVACGGREVWWKGRGAAACSAMRWSCSAWSCRSCLDRGLVVVWEGVKRLQRALDSKSLCNPVMYIVHL